MTEDRPEDDQQHDGTNVDDRRLLARLRAVDPAGDLPPLDSQAMNRLLAGTMQKPSTTGGDPTEPAAAVTAVVDLAAHRRRRVAAGVLGVAAAGAVVLAGPGLLGQDGTGQPAGGPDVVALQAPAAGGPAAICAELTPDVLAGNDVAVAGEVTSVDGETVTLTVTVVYAGPLVDGGTLTVPQGDPAQVLDGASPTFTDGADYLVAATDGFVSGCGATAAASPELQSLYEQAFGR